ncbi:MAG: cell division ATPase MinD [Candidatus Aenigmatarchaeota archaeon]|nr:cell division ATPase MinD [Candidatus Aenigmarchaeota archaeon]
MDQNIIGIFSGKGGVGKTTLTVNLSLALAQFNKNVLAIDTDFKMSGLGLHLGMYQFPVTIADVLLSEKNLLEAIYIHSSGIRIVPAPLYVKEIDTSKLKDILSAPFLSENFVILDSPPGLEKNVIDVMSACNSAIILTTPDIPAITDAIKITEKLKEMSIPIRGAVVNMNMKDSIELEDIEDVLGVNIIGVIPFDKDIKKSLSLRQPLLSFNPYSPASIEIKKIAAKIINEEFKPEKFLFLKRIIKGIKK